MTGILKATSTMCGEGTDAGPLPVLRRLVRVIIDDGKSPSDALTQDVEGLGVRSFRSFVAAVRDGRPRQRAERRRRRAPTP